MEQTTEDKINELEEKLLELTKRFEKLEKKTEKANTHKVYESPLAKAEDLSSENFIYLLEKWHKKQENSDYRKEIIESSKERKNLKEIIELDMKSWSQECQDFFIGVCKMMRIFEGDEQKQQLFNNN
jgi:hypothetical protein